jgi:hypothetical protein
MPLGWACPMALNSSMTAPLTSSCSGRVVKRTSREANNLYGHSAGLLLADNGELVGRLYDAERAGKVTDARR